jgi:hypothetical protein
MNDNSEESVRMHTNIEKYRMCILYFLLSILSTYAGLYLYGKTSTYVNTEKFAHILACSESEILYVFLVSKIFFVKPVFEVYNISSPEVYELHSIVREAGWV